MDTSIDSLLVFTEISTDVWQSQIVMDGGNAMKFRKWRLPEENSRMHWHEL